MDGVVPERNRTVDAIEKRLATTLEKVAHHERLAQQDVTEYGAQQLVPTQSKKGDRDGSPVLVVQFVQHEKVERRRYHSDPLAFLVHGKDEL